LDGKTGNIPNKLLGDLLRRYGNEVSIHKRSKRWEQNRIDYLIQEIGDMDIPGYKLHPLSGSQQKLWSIWVNGNWRMTFMFENGNAHIVNYEDYH